MKDQVGFSFLEDLIQRPMHRQPAQLSAARELTQILSDFAGINVGVITDNNPRLFHAFYAFYYSRRGKTNAPAELRIRKPSV